MVLSSTKMPVLPQHPLLSLGEEHLQLHLELGWKEILFICLLTTNFFWVAQLILPCGKISLSLASSSQNAGMSPAAGCWAFPWDEGVHHIVLALPLSPACSEGLNEEGCVH